MKQELAKLIVANGPSDDSMRVYEDYSGRGMFGKTTFGVVADYDYEVEQAIEQAIEDSPDEMEELGFYEFEENKADDHFRIDSLGMSRIYY